MRRDWDPEELIASWTLVEHDWELVGNKTGATRLGFALLLKFFELEARFPRHAGELPKAAVAYLAEHRPADSLCQALYYGRLVTIEVPMVLPLVCINAARSLVTTEGRGDIDRPRRRALPYSPMSDY